MGTTVEYARMHSQECTHATGEHAPTHMGIKD